MRFVVIGNIGSDAGWWEFENGTWVHHGGWGVEQLAEVSAALTIMREAPRLKAPGLADAAAKVVGEFVTKELGAHVKGGGAVILA